MEEAVTRKFVHEESSSILSLCGKLHVFNHIPPSVSQLDFEIFRIIASFIKISSGHSLIIKLIFIKVFRAI